VNGRNLAKIAVAMAALAAAAVAATGPGPGDVAAPIQAALKHLRDGQHLQAEQLAMELASDADRPAGRAWAIVATARQRRGELDGAIRAYRLLLASCESNHVRRHAGKQIESCRRAQGSPRRPVPARKRLDKKELAALGKVYRETYVETSDHFVVRARNPHVAKLVATEAEVNLERICRDILAGQEYPHSVEVYVWANSTDYAANAEDAPEWSGGRYSLEKRDGMLVRRIDLTQCDKSGRFAVVILDRVLPHEMCHLVVREFFGDATVPLYLNEGLAMLAEITIDNDRILLAGASVNGETKIALPNLLARDRSDMGDPALYYAESYSFSSFLHRRLSAEQFREFLHHLKTGCATVDALERAVCAPQDEAFAAQLAAAWEEDAAAQAQIVRALRGQDEAPFGAERH